MAHKISDAENIVLNHLDGGSAQQAAEIIAALARHGWLINPDDLQAIINRQRREREDAIYIMYVTESDEHPVAVDNERIREYDPEAAKEASEHGFHVWVRQFTEWKEVKFNAGE